MLSSNRLLNPRASYHTKSAMNEECFDRISRLEDARAELSDFQSQIKLYEKRHTILKPNRLKHLSEITKTISQLKDSFDKELDSLRRSTEAPHTLSVK